MEFGIQGRHISTPARPHCKLKTFPRSLKSQISNLKSQISNLKSSPLLEACFILDFSAALQTAGFVSR
jgi:hypothetical protein